MDSWLSGTVMTHRNILIQVFFASETQEMRVLSEVTALQNWSLLVQGRIYFKGIIVVEI